ncbi:MAG: hypothetical protein LBB85_11770 [Dysgonamonadaceae bacterium]|jgi:hypothetical protein|nr:hypothetical protein [Dysgonamonadaceae bacterium]
MKLTKKQRDKLLFMSGYLDGVLEAELVATGKNKEEYITDNVYNAILSAIGSIEEAIEQNDLLINML